MNYRDIAVHGIAAVFLFVLLGVKNELHAQTVKTPAHPGGYWLMYLGDNKLNSKIGIHSEVQLRNLFLNHTLETMLLRVGLNVYVKPYAMTTAGYGYFHLSPSDEGVIGSTVSEHRIWQQLILRQKYQNIFMEHRYRLEQRFLHNLTNETHQLDHRIRYRFQTLFPLYSITPHLRHFFVAANNEVMINLKGEPSKIYDRNRFFAGLGYQVSPKMNFQIGYLNQFANVTYNTKGHVDHIFLVVMSYNMDDLMQTFLNKKQDK